jgi:ribosomal protein S18 acetylase RimI-like enzyme
MAITVAKLGAVERKSMASLPAVRRFEAAGFRAWPAEQVAFDGSWQRRLAPGHPTKRPNCLVPLDPGDTRDIAERVARSQDIFAKAGVPFVIKETPLCPPELVAYLRENGWEAEAESSVQSAPLSDNLPVSAMDIIPSHDVGLFVEACQEIEASGRTSREAMHRLFSSLEPEIGMFIMSDGNALPLAVTLCVHDGQLAGLQQVAVAASERGRGLGFEITVAALKWARLRGATTAWLQVEVANEPAKALYRKLGFEEIYRYRYWRKEA